MACFLLSLIYNRLIYTNAEVQEAGRFSPQRGLCPIRNKLIWILLNIVIKSVLFQTKTLSRD